MGELDDALAEILRDTEQVLVGGGATAAEFADGMADARNAVVKARRQALEKLHAFIASGSCRVH